MPELFRAFEKVTFTDQEPFSKTKSVVRLDYSSTGKLTRTKVFIKPTDTLDSLLQDNVRAYTRMMDAHAQIARLAAPHLAASSTRRHAS